MKALLLLLALCEAAVPKVSLKTPPARPVVNAQAPSVSLALAPLQTVLTPRFAPAANDDIFVRSAPAIEAAAVPSIEAASAPTIEAAEAEADRLARKFDNAAGPLEAKIARRIEELKLKLEQERAAGALNASDDLGLGHVAEIMVIHAEKPRLINVSEEVVRDGSVIGEIDAETHTHLIEVASGRLDSGKKSKVQQFIKFLRPEAKRRGKPVKYYFNPKKADPDDIDRIIKLGDRQGVKVEFEPIPWELDLLKSWKLL